MPVSRKRIRKQARKAAVTGKFPLRLRTEERFGLEKSEQNIRAEAEAQKSYRELDRESRWGYFRTSLPNVENSLQFSITGWIESRIKNHTPQNPLKVLDLGCGAGTALGELKQRFRDRIRTVGQVLEKSPGEKYQGIDRLAEGSFPQKRLHESFDLIFSHMGSTDYTKLQLHTIEETLKLLKPGGIAIVGLSSVSPLSERAIKTILMQNGIKNSEIYCSPRIGYFLRFSKPQLRKLP
jgi:SAM-dependent methyltransferase